MSEKKRDRVMGHGGDNDGIEEYDNPLPDWWVGLCLFTVVGGIGYGIDYHFVEHTSQKKQYDAEIADADKRWPQQAAVAADLSPATVEAGRAIFAQNCVACHAADMHGKIGPNLVDDQWLHGGSLQEITHTITVGVPDKGMLTWGPILGPEKISQVAAFVYMQGPKLGLVPPPGVAPGTPVNVPGTAVAPPPPNPTPPAGGKG